MKDWRGTEIKVGSLIVYPVRQSSSLWVNEARVTEIIPYSGSRTDKWAPIGTLKAQTTRMYDSWSKPGKVVTVSCVERVTVVPEVE